MSEHEHEHDPGRPRTEEAAPLERTGPPWELPAPLLSRLIATTQGLLFQPVHFFATLRREGRLGPPMIYAILTGIVSGLIANLYVHFFGDPLPQSPLKESLQVTLADRILASFLVTPLLVPVLVLLSAGVFHFFLHLLGGARHPFVATARLSAYTHGATSLFLLIPGLGPFLQLASYILLSVLGLADIQETTRGRAAAAVLLPVVMMFLTCCAVTFIVSLVAPGVLDQLS